MSESIWGICEECNQPITTEWCKECNAKRFQQNFKNWTSGNDDIDKFIQHTQLSASYNGVVLEWIPYDRFYDIKCIAKGNFGNVYKANWIDGYIMYWYDKILYRDGKNKFVALKSSNNSKNITLDFINEITSHHKVNTGLIVKFYGITQDPETKNYMMVLDYAHNGSLRDYLKNKIYTSWTVKIFNLCNIALGLYTIHKKDLIHQNLHIGNILNYSFTGSFSSFISDMRLCKPADYNASENTKNNIYGVLPYIAPEILRGQNYTKASDVYSFGIIMYEVFSGLPPYYNVSHDEGLAIKICQGFRPRFNIKMPQLIVNLIKRCLDANPLNRPTTDELKKILCQWCMNYAMEIQEQIEEADEINNYLLASGLLSTNLPYKRHSEAIYTSRLFNFNNLPEPKNSDDYYREQNDDIISEKFLESSLQIDLSQLKISE